MIAQLLGKEADKGLRNRVPGLPGSVSVVPWLSARPGAGVKG